MTSPTVPGYGWIPALPDFRDLKLAFPQVSLADTPDRVDLRDPAPGKDRSCLPPVQNQGELGSCTAHMAAAAYAHDLAWEYGTFDFAASRLFVYYCSRAIRGTVAVDSGASIADAAKALNQYGAPPEDEWAYDITKFADMPSPAAYAAGKARIAVRYARVGQDPSSVQQCLAAGVPVCFGFSVYDHFESASMRVNGILNAPAPTERVRGGHAVLCIGYLTGAELLRRANAMSASANVDPAATYYIVRNSWGPAWGDNGYFYMNGSYLMNPQLAGDLWAIQDVSSPAPAPIPTPAPQPVPVPPVDADSAFIAAAEPWAANPRSWKKSSAAAEAYRTWKEHR